MRTQIAAGVQRIMCDKTLYECRILPAIRRTQSIDQRIDIRAQWKGQLCRIKITAPLPDILSIVIAEQHDLAPGAGKIKQHAGVIAHQHIGCVEHIVGIQSLRKCDDVTQMAQLQLLMIQAVQLGPQHHVIVQPVVDLLQQILQLFALRTGIDIDHLAPPGGQIGDDPLIRHSQRMPKRISSLFVKKNAVAGITAIDDPGMHHSFELIGMFDPLPCVDIGHDEKICQRKSALLIADDIFIGHIVKAQRLERCPMPGGDAALTASL